VTEARAGKIVILIFQRERQRDALRQVMAMQIFKLPKTKRNLQQIPLFNNAELCSYSQPSQDWPSLYLDTRLLIQIATVLQKKHPAKTDHLSVG